MRRTPPIRMDTFGSDPPFSSHRSRRSDWNANAQISSSQEDIMHKSNEVIVTRTTDVETSDGNVEAGRSHNWYEVGRAF